MKGSAPAPTSEEHCVPLAGEGEALRFTASDSMPHGVREPSRSHVLYLSVRTMGMKQRSAPSIGCDAASGRDRRAESSKWRHAVNRGSKGGRRTEANAAGEVRSEPGPEDLGNIRGQLGSVRSAPLCPTSRLHRGGGREGRREERDESEIYLESAQEDREG